MASGTIEAQILQYILQSLFAKLSERLSVYIFLENN
jgi:hypothetical protein